MWICHRSTALPVILVMCARGAVISYDNCAVWYESTPRCLLLVNLNSSSFFILRGASSENALSHLRVCQVSEEELVPYVLDSAAVWSEFVHLCVCVWGFSAQLCQVQDGSRRVNALLRWFVLEHDVPLNNDLTFVSVWNRCINVVTQVNILARLVFSSFETAADNV